MSAGAERTVEEIDALIAQRRIAEASQMARSALERGELDADTAWRLQLRLSSIAFMTHQSDDALTNAAEIARQAGLEHGVYGAAEAIRLLTMLADGDLALAREHAEAILSGAAAPPGEEATAGALTTLAMLAWTQGRPADAIGLLRASLRRTESEPVQSRHLHPRQHLAVALTAAGEFDEARALLAQDREEIEANGDSLWMPSVLTLQSRLELASGDLDAATTAAEAAVDTGQEVGAHLALPLALATLAAIALLRGDFDAAKDTIARCRAANVPGLAFEATLSTWFQARLVEIEHGPQAGAALVADIYVDPWSHVRLFLEEPALPPWLVRTALRAGDRRRAERIRDALQLIATHNSAVASVVATSRHAAGLCDSDANALLDAATSHPHMWPSGLAREDLGTLVRSTDRRAASRHLERALEVYEQMGAHYEARRVRAQLARSAAVPDAPSTVTTGWESLTPTEQRVADLVIEGLTNREIADRLHVSRHTVDFHLRQVYRKLDVHSRVALAHLATRRD
jgi:DNA-binding CsgD family transcriptional regulator/tetratricopeptide (TPR) repeat protein